MLASFFSELLIPCHSLHVRNLTYATSVNTENSAQLKTGLPRQSTVVVLSGFQTDFPQRVSRLDKLFCRCGAGWTICISGKLKLDRISDLDRSTVPRNVYQKPGVHSPVLSVIVQLSPVPFSYLSNFRPGAVVIRSLLQHSLSSCSPKSPSVLSRLLPSPFPSSPNPLSKCEFPWLCYALPYRDPTFVSLMALWSELERAVLVTEATPLASSASLRLEGSRETMSVTTTQTSTVPLIMSPDLPITKSSTPLPSPLFAPSSS